MKRFILFLLRQGVAGEAGRGLSPSQAAVSARQDAVASVQANTYFAKVVAAAATRDTERLAELTHDEAPNEGLRKLLAEMQQGEPLKELEPDEISLHRHGRPGNRIGSRCARRWIRRPWPSGRGRWLPSWFQRCPEYGLLFWSIACLSVMPSI